MNNVSLELRNKIFKRNNYACQKCGFSDPNGKNLEIHYIDSKVLGGTKEERNAITLCSICHKHAPDNKLGLNQFVSEKIDGEILNTFRKSDYSISKKTKLGMIKSFKKGLHITKAPRGYKLVNKKLIVNESSAKNVKDIFEEFLNTNTSLTQIAKKHNLTTSGLKKLLMNTTYLGKVKFSNEESQGEHISIIDENLFKSVQEKLGQKTKL
ncbi:MAG: HNH endonuclease [Nanoarchaeota archaeon]|nr:HNH endonuclease [Nanoarchaeota archaeon]